MPEKHCEKHESVPIWHDCAWILNSKGADHPIVPVMLYDAKVAKEMSKRLLEKGIYVIAFSYPVVPEGQAHSRANFRRAYLRANR